VQNSLSNSIGRRLLKLVFSCYFLVALAVTISQLYFEYHNTKRDTFLELSGLGETVKNNLIQGLWNYDIEQIDSALVGIEKNNIVRATKVIGNDGQFISGSYSKLFGDESQATNPGSKFSESRSEGNVGGGHVIGYKANAGGDNSTLFEFKFPLIYVDEDKKINDKVGYGYLYTDHKYILLKVQYSFALIIMNSIVKTLALWFIFLFFVNRIISRPLNLLTSTARNFDPKNAKLVGSDKDHIERIIKSKKNDELSTLVKSFQSMRDMVIESFRVIEKQNENLEQRVAERTEALQKVNKQLEHNSLHDALTGLPNRKYFEGNLDQRLQRSIRDCACFAVAIVDLQDFKSINDMHGHQAGDAVLQTIATRMSAVIKDAGIVARLGGDEFAIILHDATDAEARVIGEALAQCMSQPIPFEEEEICASLNIGFAFHPEHGENAHVLLKKADIAMYQAKHARIGFVIFSSLVKEDIERRFVLESSLAAKDFLDQLEVLYQPVICQKNRTIKGLEALVRWHHPELGLVLPSEFIPMTERLQAIRSLSTWVSLQAMNDAQALHKLGHEFSISINLSGRLLEDSSFTHELRQLLAESGLDPQQVILEITETIAMSNTEQTLEILSQLKACGVKLAIDDFGTGYSSFSYLTRLPIDELKIDRSFLLDTSRNSKIVMQGIIDLAHDLDLKVVAEGVEDESVIETLESLGCDYFQGYYYSPPVTFDALVSWIDDYNSTEREQSQYQKAG